jgi:hypothetical protein
MELQQIVDELKKWIEANNNGIAAAARKAGIFSDVRFTLDLLANNLAFVANQLTNYTSYQPTGEDLVRAYFDARQVLDRAIARSDENRTVKGPAAIVYIVQEDSGGKYVRGPWRFEHRQLVPGEEFTGKCIAYRIGDWD